MNKVVVSLVNFLLLAGLLFTVSCKKKDKPDLTKAFVKYYGGFKGHKASEVLQTSDGGYVIAGTSTNEGVGDIIVIKTDAEGNEMWHKILGKTSYYDECGSIALMPDGGYMVVGTSALKTDRVFDITSLEATKDSTSLFATRLSSLGDIIWSKNYPNPSSINVQVGTFGTSVAVESNGDCLLAGMVDSTGATTTLDIYCFIIDKNGALLKVGGIDMSPYTDGAYAQNDFVTQATQAFGSGLPYEYLIMSSTVITGENTPRLVSIRLNSNLFTQNNAPTKTDWFEPTYYDVNKASRLTGQKYIIAGTKGTPPLSSDIFVLELANNLTTKLNSWTFGDQTAGTKDVGITAIPTADGGYAILGITNSTIFTGDAAKLDDVLLIKTDQYGTEQWHKVFGGRGNDAATTLLQTSDGGYLICGTITFGDDVSNSGNSNAITLIKLNKDGELLNVE
jgi:hypothetical protein